MMALIIGSWAESVKYWILSATLTNLVSITLLILIFRSEGRRFMEIFYFNKKEWKKDTLTFICLSLLILPVIILPNYLLTTMLWNDPQAPVAIMFQPLSGYLTGLLLFAFPVTIFFAELATYFGYIMPRLRKQLKHKPLVVLLPVLFLSIQHCTLPLLFDTNFMVYRGVMFLPFALLIGIVLFKRPRLLPYFAALHGLLDLGTVMMLMR